MWPIQYWPVRGFIYIFVGLYAWESSHEYVDEAGSVERSTNPIAMQVVQYSGNVLIVSGLVYVTMGICCCRGCVKEPLRKQMLNARANLKKHNIQDEDL